MVDRCDGWMWSIYVMDVVDRCDGWMWSIDVMYVVDGCDGCGRYM